MKMRFLGVALAGAALAISAQADAQIIDYTLSGAGSGTMALDYNGSTYSLDSLNLTFGTATFTQANSILLGSGASYCISSDPLIPSTCSATNNLDSFWVAFFDPSLAAQTANSDYSNTGDPVIHTGQVTITQVTAVPEPATWATMLLGLGAVGFGMRRSRTRLEPPPTRRLAS